MLISEIFTSKIRSFWKILKLNNRDFIRNSEKCSNLNNLNVHEKEIISFMLKKSSCFYLEISDYFWFLIITVKQTIHEQFIDFKKSTHWKLLVIRHKKLYMLKYHDIIIIMKLNKNWIIMIPFSKRYNDENLSWCDSEHISNANFISFFNHKTMNLSSIAMQN
jgi:hypothetical protein